MQDKIKQLAEENKHLKLKIDMSQDKNDDSRGLKEEIEE